MLDVKGHCSSLKKELELEPVKIAKQTKLVEGGYW
jgi:hypothetical protein